MSLDEAVRPRAWASSRSPAKNRLRGVGTSDPSSRADDHPAGATVAKGAAEMDTGIATERPGLKQYDPGVPHTLDYPAIPLQQFLPDTAARHPRPAAPASDAAAGRPPR